MNLNKCSVCGNQHNNGLFRAKELNLGLNDEFEYLECNKCGCLQLLNEPTDFSRYYPDDYYSFVTPKTFKFKKLLRKYRILFLLHHFTILGYLLSFKKSKPQYIDWFETIGIDLHSKILDVGCGVGNLLKDLSDVGFTNLTGIDPFVSSDLTYNNVHIYKNEIFDIEDTFDLIMLNHSFEHMSYPEQALQKIFTLVKPGGYVLIRIPVASSFAWKHYKSNWVQLDAPRHIFLHTVQSMNLLADRTGFTIKNIIYDSTDYQFTGSELYQKGIPKEKRLSYSFSKNELKTFKEQAEELNKKCNGDQACFYLQRPPLA